MKLPRPLATVLIVCLATAFAGYVLGARHAASRRLVSWKLQQEQRRTPDWIDEPWLEVHTLPQPGYGSLDPSEWLELIEAIVLERGRSDDPFAYRDYMAVTPGALVVYHNAEVQRDIAAILQAFSERAQQPTSFEPLWLPPGEDSPNRRRIVAALDEPSSLDCENRPLCEAIDELAKRHRVAIVLNRKCLYDAGLDPAIPVTLHLRGTTLASLLFHLLGKYELTYAVRNNALWITTPDDAEEVEFYVAYPVADLLPDGPDFTSLTNLIVSNVAPQSWDPASNGPFCPHLGSDWLFVKQVPQVHDAIDQFLRQLRRKLYPADADALWPRSLAERSELRITVALEQPRAFRFSGVPLREVCRRLEAELNVPILLNNKVLDDADISPELPVTCNLPARPAGENLRALLVLLGLDFRVSREVVSIAPRDAFYGEFPHIYDIRDLEWGGLKSERIKELVANLSPILSNRTFTDDFRGLLIAQGDHSEQGRVRCTLTAIRQCLQQQPSGDAPWIIAAERDAESERVEALLAEPVAVDFRFVPLDMALLQVARDYDLPLTIQSRAHDWPLIDLAESRTLGGVLDSLLWPYGFDYYLAGGKLWVTDAPVDRGWETRMYRLPATKFGGSVNQFQAAIQLLIGTQGPEPRDSHFFCVESLTPEWIAVNADWQAHQLLADWLTEQRSGSPPLRSLERNELSAAIAQQLDDRSELEIQIVPNFEPPLPINRRGQP